MTLSKDTNSKDGAAKGRILFLDDDDDTCEMIKLMLGQAGYEVVIGRSVAEGLQLIRKKSFDMILTDWYFEDGTGIELCHAVRQSGEQTPVFIYTGMVQDNHLQSALRAGAQGFFVKPVEMKTLLNTISSQIGSHDQDGDRQ